MTKFSQKQVERSILHINKIIGRESPHSTYDGLRLITAAFAALLDVYAQPNEENPEGMADDPRAFRRHFCDLLNEVFWVRDGAGDRGKLRRGRAGQEEQRREFEQAQHLRLTGLHNLDRRHFCDLLNEVPLLKKRVKLKATA